MFPSETKVYKWSVRKKRIANTDGFEHHMSLEYTSQCKESEVAKLEKQRWAPTVDCEMEILRWLPGFSSSKGFPQI